MSVESTNKMEAIEKEIWSLLEEVKDPEIPVLSVIDLGIVRDVKVDSDNEGNTKKENKITITITPTYSGCPALDVIRMDIRLKLIEKGFKDISINQSLSPAWTTDWMTEKGKENLRKY